MIAINKICPLKKYYIINFGLFRHVKGFVNGGVPAGKSLLSTCSEQGNQLFYPAMHTKKSFFGILCWRNVPRVLLIQVRSN